MYFNQLIKSKKNQTQKYKTMEKRFDSAISALVNAFFDETLASGNCTACAVGNIVAHAHGAKVMKRKTGYATAYDCTIPNHFWARLFTTSDDWQAFAKIQNPYALELIKKTGYSVEELAKVEFAFERACKISFTRYYRYTQAEVMEDQHRGLMAVVDVLCEIEGVEPLQYKKMFDFQKV